MAVQTFKDDNGVSIGTTQGLRPAVGTSNIVSATMTGSVQKIVLPAGFAAAASQSGGGGHQLVRIATGSQAAFIAFDGNVSAGTYTGIGDMMYIPPNWIQDVKIRGIDTYIFILQAQSAGTVQVLALV